MAGNIPIGCRFRPTEDELICLLLLKVTNQLNETDCVKEKTVYGEHGSPWHVFGDNDVLWEGFDEGGKKPSTKRMVYVFTKLTKLSAHRKARTAGLGTWQGETKTTPIHDFVTGEKIGSKKMLSYVLNSGLKAVKGSWIMHEYSLDGSSLNGINDSHNTDYKICRIIRDDSKYCKVKASAIKTVSAVNTDGAITTECLGNPGSSSNRPEISCKRIPSFDEAATSLAPCKKFRNNSMESAKDGLVDHLAVVRTEDEPQNDADSAKHFAHGRLPECP